MRILYVIPFFAPAWGYGGPPRQVFDLSRELARRGHAVRVITTDSLDGTARIATRSEMLEGVGVDRVPNVSNWLAWNYKIFLPVGFRSAFARAAREAEIVHMFDFRDLLNAFAIDRLGRAGLPFVLSAFGEVPRASGPKRWAKHVFDLVWGYRLIKDAAALVAQTDDEASWYWRFGARPEQVRVIPLAVDVDRITASGNANAFRAGLGISPSELMVLFLGRIHAYKGVDLLIRAFARVRETRPNVRLVIAGRDDGFLVSAQRLAAQIAPSGSVIFPGPVYGDARFEAYRAANLFALTPSHAEQTSLAALEACACGTPALVTRQAPIPGLDASGGGMTVKYDELAVSGCLAGLLEANLEEMGQRARELIHRRFALPVVAGALEGLYLDAVRPSTADTATAV